jgi:hypothetical protein
MVSILVIFMGLAVLWVWWFVTIDPARFGVPWSKRFRFAPGVGIRHAGLAQFTGNLKQSGVLCSCSGPWRTGSMVSKEARPKFFFEQPLNPGYRI